MREVTRKEALEISRKVLEEAETARTPPSKRPWKLHRNFILDANDTPIAEVYTAASTEQEKANARLLCAAPLLLKALKELYDDYCDEDYFRRDVISDLVEEALREAE